METNHESKYRKIESLKFLYEISDDGRVVRNVKSKKVHTQHLDKDGYYIVNLKINDKYRLYKVHRLQAEVHYGPCPEGYECDHINRNRKDNSYGNVHWISKKDNIANRDMSNVGWSGTEVTVDDKPFKSCTAAAKYIAELEGGSFNTYRHYFKTRRHYIKGHKISYSI